MLFQYANFSCTPVPLSNFLHAFGFNISASPASQQLLALIWSNFPPPRLSSNFLNFLLSLGFNIYGALQGVQGPAPCDTLGFPPPSHSPSSSQFLLFTLLLAFQSRRSSTWCQPVWKCPTWGHASGLPPGYISAISSIHSLGLKTSPLAS